MADWSKEDKAKQAELIRFLAKQLLKEEHQPVEIDAENKKRKVLN